MPTTLSPRRRTRGRGYSSRSIHCRYIDTLRGNGGAGSALLKDKDSLLLSKRSIQGVLDLGRESKFSRPLVFVLKRTQRELGFARVCSNVKMIIQIAQRPTIQSTQDSFKNLECSRLVMRDGV